MGSDPSRGPAVTRLFWSLVDIVSRMLERDERDAVRGDLAEAGECAGKALLSVLGLAVRRQAALWKDWRPWLVFVGLVAPLGMLVSLVSSRVAGLSAIYSWMYFSNWDWALLGHRAFWIVLGQTIALVFPDTLALICLSWSLGSLLGILSRRTIPVIGALFCLVLLFGELVAVPQYTQLQLLFLQHMLGQGMLHRNDNYAVFSLMFYKVVFPALVQIVLVLLPSFWGMSKGLGMATLPLLLRMIVWAPTIAIMALLATRQAVFLAAIATHNLTWLQHGWQMPPLLLAVVGPVVYWVTTTGWPRWFGNDRRPIVL